jgi:phosphoserine phosphatase RsbU/P
MDMNASALQELEVYRPLPEIAAELQLGGATADPSQTNAHVMQLFELDASLDAVTVVQAGAPQGLLFRHAFHNRFARPYARELYLNKTCATFADVGALVVEGRTPIAEIGQSVAERGESALTQGFVVVDGGRYLGHCRGITLMRALSDLQGEQHKQLLSSIDYASTIQQALLADSRAALQSAFGEGHALVWRPRDVVGGDCFFARESEDGVLAGVIDCTGHGVPGALLTSIAISEVNRLAADGELRQRPGALISALNGRIKAALQQQKDELDFQRSDDGMDAVFLWLPRGGDVGKVASAKLPVFVLDADGEIQQLKGDRKGVGYRSTAADFAWGEQEIERRPGRRVVLATDGVCDQIGEHRAMAYGWPRFKASLQAAAGQPVATQAETAFEQFLRHQGRQARRDDVTLIALDLSPRQEG